jgi:lipopolysaccharide/colanic/teichoic acid biosynthesis glycosyltransferase
MASALQEPGTDMRQLPDEGRLAPRGWVDVPLALLALLLLSPVMLAAALAVRLTRAPSCSARRASAAARSRSAC